MFLAENLFYPVKFTKIRIVIEFPVFKFYCTGCSKVFTFALCFSASCILKDFHHLNYWCVAKGKKKEIVNKDLILEIATESVNGYKQEDL